MGQTVSLWVTRLIYLLGIGSIAARTTVSLSDWLNAQKFVGFLSYFAGVPGAYLQYAGLTTDADSELTIAITAVLICCLTVAFGAWSEKIVTRTSSGQSSIFLSTLVSLCILHYGIIYLWSGYRISLWFENVDIASGHGTNFWPSILIACGQVGLSVLFFFVWDRKTSRPVSG